MDFEQAKDSFNDFESRCQAARSEQIRRIREDRAFLSGNQWGDEDNDLIAKNRPRRTINIISNSINATRNQYSDYPYMWYTGDDELDIGSANFLKYGGNSRAAKDALLSSISFGIGAMCLGSETDSDGVEMPCIYAPTDICNVYIDPDSLDIDGGDAMEGAIIEYRSRDWIRKKYGEEIAGRDGDKPMVNVSCDYDSKCLPIVTYYIKENDVVTMYVMCNNDFISEPVELPISRIPIFPVYGERTYEDDGTPLWQGLVRKGRPVQKVINYAFTQLGERLALAPKPTFITTVEAVEGLDEGYRNFSKNLNPLLMYNRTTEDGETTLDKPQRIDNSVNYADVTGIISSNLELLSSITGVDSKGIIDTASQLTATEVNYNERQFSTNIKHYFDNLRDSFKALGQCVFEFLGMKNVGVEVIQGPGERMERQLARTELQTIAQYLPEDKKKFIVNGILESHGENALLRKVYGELNKTQEPTAMEQQAFATIEQMKQAIEERDQKMAEMQKQIAFYENSKQDQKLGYEMQLLQNQQAHKNELETIAFKASLENGADAEKMRLEAEKASLELQKKAVELDAAKTKATIEAAKQMGGIV